jgi:DNA-binding NarL/FixJ family response regulator
MAFRVLVAEDSLLVREGVVRLLEQAPGVEVVAACRDLPGLLAGVGAARPDVIVTDVRMPPTGTDEGIAAALRLRSTHPDLGVVVLSQYDEPEYVLRLLEAGSARRAYLLKDRLIDPGHLITAIETVAEGGSVIDPRVVETLVRARSRDRASPLWTLTRREREVLQLMAEGRNNDAIAAALFLSVRVVEKHINAIFSKLCLGEAPDIHRRVKAVLIYLARDDE